MKTKTINKVIAAKIDDWLSSIEDESLRDDLRHHVVVTGGCITSMLLGEKVNDYDIYLDSIDLAHRLAEYYVERFEVKSKAGIEAKIYAERLSDRVRIVVKSSGVASEEGTVVPYEYFEGRPDPAADRYVTAIMGDPGDIEDTMDETQEAATQDNDALKRPYRPVFLSTNAITLSGRVQVVLRFSGSPSEIHENYDYVHCTNYWYSKEGGELVLKKEALESILSRELRYVGSKYPLCSLIRMRKFIQRGWTINAGQILKMVWQLGEMNLKDISVLQDQLTGVDAAYFVQLVSRLRENDPEKVNSAYLVEIINRMF